MQHDPTAASNAGQPAQAAPPPQSSSTEPTTYYNACCTTAPYSKQRAAGFNIIESFCNPLFQNCSVAGCSDVSVGDVKYKICECETNYVFYIFLCLGVFGLYMGSKYMPATRPKSGDDGADGDELLITCPDGGSAKYLAQMLGFLGWLMSFSSFGYFLYRGIAVEASMQLNPKTCTARTKKG